MEAVLTANGTVLMAGVRKLLVRIQATLSTRGTLWPCFGIISFQPLAATDAWKYRRVIDPHLGGAV